MSNQVKKLEERLAVLEQINAQKTQIISSKDDRIRLLEEQIEYLKLLHFGRSADQYKVDPNQPSLFDEQELAELNPIEGDESP